MSITKDTSTIKIGKGEITAEFNLQNAQLFSLMRRGVEVMWPGGAPEDRRPAYGWQNSEILMFPVVGRPVDGKVLIDGILFNMTQHGTARYLPWEIYSNLDGVIMVQSYRAGQKVDDKKGVISEFPRSYTLTKSYSFDDDGLVFTLYIENRSDLPLPYAVGWHPAFMATEEGSVIFGSYNPQTIYLKGIRASPDNVLELDHPNSMMTYRNPDFKLGLKHNFGRVQIWDKGEGYVALEPITAPSLSRSENSKEDELASQYCYRTLMRGEGYTFKADIHIL